MTVRNQPHGPTAEQAYHQQQASVGTAINFYQMLPLETVKLISEYVATGNTPIEAARNAIIAGLVDQCFHAITHEDPIAGVIDRGAHSPDKWIRGTDEECVAVWPRSVQHLVDYTGRVLKTQVTGGGRL